MDILDTKIAIIEEDSMDYKAIKEAAEVIKNSGLVAFPTETVYGLGANALNEAAVKKIFEAKGRPQDNPLIIHVADKDINRYVKEIPEIAKKLMDKFWPGPLTIILKKADIVPSVTSASLDTVGVRMPNTQIALELIKASGVPIAAPSANISGRPSPTDFQRCIEDLKGRVDYILGGEISRVGLESTIVDCTVNPPCILRPGAITLEMLRGIDSNIYIDAAIMNKPKEDLKPKAPGMKYRHYAPKAKLKIIEGDLQKTIEKINEMVLNYIDENLKVGIMATDESMDYYKAGEVISLGSRANLQEIAQNLFETLRTFDDKNVDIILSEAFIREGLGIAIMNRLTKAAGFDIMKID